MTSCNGCRVLRTGCTNDCSIRPCLQWIKTPESQAHATVFLAKFYGRAGLLNLINAGPDHHRPATFRSMLYEACGRIVDPVQGSVGLIRSGKWQLCQAAVDAVLQGSPITPTNSSSVDSATAAGSTIAPPLKFYDIRHVTKRAVGASRPSFGLNSVVQNRTRCKRSAPRAAKIRPCPGSSPANWTWRYPVEVPRTPSQESGSRENESIFSVESAGASHVSQAEPWVGAEGDEVGLELTLGLNPVWL